MSLEDLKNEAAAIDAEAAPKQTEPQQADGQPATGENVAVVDYNAEAHGMIEFAAELFFPLSPSLEKVYTPEKRARLSGALGPLMQKYNLTMGGIFDRWAVEVQFLIVTVPLIAPTVQAIRADRQADLEGGQVVQVQQPVQSAGLQPIIDQPDPTSLHNKV